MELSNTPFTSPEPACQELGLEDGKIGCRRTAWLTVTFEKTTKRTNLRLQFARMAPPRGSRTPPHFRLIHRRFASSSPDRPCPDPTPRVKSSRWRAPPRRRRRFRSPAAGWLGRVTGRSGSRPGGG